MKEKLEQLKELHKEFKEYCYELGKKWLEYEKKLYKSNYYYYYDFSEKNIKDLDLDLDFDEMEIGYEEYRCGDTDRYYNYFTNEEIIDENLIKQKIDKRYEKLEQDKKLKEKEEKSKKEAAEKREFETYQKLKEKYEN